MNRDKEKQTKKKENPNENIGPKDRKEQIKLLDLKIIKVLKENTNEYKTMMIDELARRVYDMNEEQWKGIGHNGKGDKRAGVANKVEQIVDEWGEGCPIKYAVCEKEELKKQYPSEKSRYELWYCHEITRQDMNLLFAGLMQCDMIPCSECKSLVDKLLKISCIDTPNMYSKLEDVYIQHTAINSEETVKEKKIENHLLVNLEKLLIYMTEPDEGKRHKIEFDYCHFDKDGKRVPYNDKDSKYKLSPAYLTIENGRFWLLGVMDKYPSKYSRYAVDRMKNIEEVLKEEAIGLSVSEQEARDEIEKYVSRHMYGSYEKPEEIEIKLLKKDGKYDAAYDAVYDAFGADLIWEEDQGDGCERIKVIRSPYGIIQWALLNAERVEIETESIRERIRETQLKQLNELYKV